MRIIIFCITFFIPLLCSGATLNFGGGSSLVVGGGSSVSLQGGGYSTTVFSDDFSGDLSGWTSEVDPNSEGDISAGEYAITVNDTDQIYLRKVITANDAVEVAFDINFSTLSYFGGSTRYQNILAMRDGVGALLTVRAHGSGATLDQINVQYVDDSTTITGTVQAVSWVANTSHTIVATYEVASSAGANDGVVKLTFDGATIFNITNVDNDTKAGVSDVRLGVQYTTATTPSGTVKFDDVTVKTP